MGLIVLTMALGGCHVSGTGTPEKTAANVQTAETKQAADSPIPEAALAIQTSALEYLDAISQPKSGIQPYYNDCLDARTPLSKAMLSAVSKRSDGAWMLLALRTAEDDIGQIPKAIEMIDNLKEKPRDVSIDDALDFHLGRLWQRHAVELEGDEAVKALRKAYDAFDAVTQVRTSPYYHLARAEKLKAGIALKLDITQDLENFIATYPDYPDLLSFKLELATRQFDEGNSDIAVRSVQDYAYFYPWSSIAPKALQWLEDRGDSQRERTFDEVFSRVDSLRRARFWDEAEAAAVEAIEQYPESYQLKVQHARIAYERSEHEESAHRFEKILEQLNGETKDKLKPSGVIAYIYRAYAYMGDCKKALEYHALNAAKLGKKDRASATMDFALSCGALDVAWENAKIAYADAKSGTDFWWFGLIAYLNGEYETARAYFAAAVEDLSGTSKRRVQYFIAQATLKSALKQASQGETKPAETSEIVPDKPAKTKSKSSKTSKKSTKSKKTAKKGKGKKIPKLAPASVERAKSQFEALIASDDSDYYAILAYSRLSELERGNDSSAPRTPVMQDYEHLSQEPVPPRPWDMEFSFDEKELLESWSTNVEKYKGMFPELERVAFFHDAELYRERNMLFRVIALEAMGISRMSKRPTVQNLWTAKLSADGHLVDNRKKKTGFWGIASNVQRFSLPGKKEIDARKAIAQRQSEIYDHASELRTFVVSTVKAFHDYYLARKYTAAPRQTCGSASNIDVCSTLYPHAFHEAVIRASQNNKITPDLIWALMNIESAFNPDSISHADAYGLLQIIPMTGYKIAKALGIDAFGPYDLIRPEASISMGTWYFAQILHKFQGYATLSMAAYNGGPHQVARWLTAYSKIMEQDAFIELIPYDEARNYVKKGMARLLIFYRTDEHDPKRFFEIPNTLPDSFEVMPNY